MGVVGDGESTVRIEGIEGQEYVWEYRGGLTENNDCCDLRLLGSGGLGNLFLMW
jgi:hypothetical protein